MGWFLLVGGAAAAVHWAVVFALVSFAGWPPLWANVLGWMSAFGFSFTGHHQLSFRGHGAPVRSSLGRFLLVSAVGFAVNETAYALLLQAAGVRYDLALIGVLGGVALLSYVMGRYWAFSGNPGHWPRR